MDLARLGLLPLALPLTFVGFGLAEPRVLGGGNVQDVLVQASYPAVFAAAQAFVLLTRGFDLSLSSPSRSWASFATQTRGDP